MPTTVGQAGHHALPEHQVVLLLETHPERGLSEQEAHSRLARWGANVLPPPRRRGPVVRVLRHFHHPLVYVLLVALALTIALAEWIESAVIAGVVLVNVVVGFLQEERAEKALSALMAMTRTHAIVVRDGERVRLDSTELVPGDVVALEAGDKVPADMRLLRVRGLSIDESALTGESVPVAKQAVAVDESAELADRANMAFSGSLVVAGTATGVVVATGGDTELGLIHRLVGESGGVQTPLTRKLAAFSRLLTVVILVLAGLTFVLGLSRGEPVADMVTAAIALAVGAIPEGLPAAVTIILAIGVSRMARRHAIIRRLPAVETLGATTVVCSDKTGTLTQNQMTVTTVVTASGRYAVTGTGYEPSGRVLDGDGTPVANGTDAALAETLQAGVLCNDSVLKHRDDEWVAVGDPTEVALLSAAAKAGIDGAHLVEQHRRIDEIPFSSETQRMATLHAEPDTEQRLLVVKGGVEAVLPLAGSVRAADGHVCPLDPAWVAQAVDEMGRQALRVLAVASVAVPAGTDRLAAADLDAPRFTLLGLVGMHDPPRPEAVASIRTCHRAGIEVKMITGDHAATARAIAAEIGLGTHQGDPVAVTGAELRDLSSADFARAAASANVLARVTPEHKLRLVETLQAQNHVVAMTGDGVNDAPALRQADIGIAMGHAGTEVAKDASAMVLTDDNFATIEAAVEEGRGVYDNITKFITWTLPTNLGEGLVILTAIMLGATLPVLPVQVLWINMTTALLLGLMLVFEPKEPGIMDRPPRDPDQPILTRVLVERIVLVSVLMLIGAFGLFEYELASGATTAEARTVAVNVFVLVETAYLLNCRSLTQSFMTLGFFSNPPLLAGMAAMVALQGLFTYLPFFHVVFESAPIDLAAWGRIVAVALSVMLVVGVEKALRRRGSGGAQAGVGTTRSGSGGSTLME
ncbi:MAG: HAD-IC family P-type ATPase [Jiangellales bacterium]